MVAPPGPVDHGSGPVPTGQITEADEVPTEYMLRPA
jgi:hypothetical protein